MHLKRLKQEIIEEVTQELKAMNPEATIESSRTLQEIICITEPATYTINLTLYDDQKNIKINTRCRPRKYQSNLIACESNTIVKIEIENPNFIKQLAKDCLSRIRT